MADITKECCDLNIIQHKNGGVVWTDPNDGHEVIQSYEVAGASMAADQETFTAVMSTYITNSPRFND